MTKLKKCFLAWLLPILITLGLLGYSGIASAVPFLDFNMDAIHPGGASVSYAGGNNPLIGSNLSVDSVVGIGTPSYPGGMLPIVGGALNFTTGNLTSSDANNWYFGGQGSITITGSIDLDNNGTFDITGNLLTGTFTSASVTNAGGGVFKVAIASFTDSKAQQLTNQYGLPDSLYDGNFNISFFAGGSPPQAFQSSSILSGDVVNNPVPEPATVSLFGCGLIGLTWFGRRKSRKA